MADQSKGFFDECVEVFGLYIQLAGSGEIQEAAGNGIGAINGVAHFLEDDIDILVLAGELAVEVVDAHHHDGKRIFDLMRNPGGEGADGFHFLGLNELELG